MIRHRLSRLAACADGATVRSATQLRNAIGLTPVGRAIRLSILRDRMTQTVDVTVAAPDERASVN